MSKWGKYSLQYPESNKIVGLLSGGGSGGGWGGGGAEEIAGFFLTSRRTEPCISSTEEQN